MAAATTGRQTYRHGAKTTWQQTAPLPALLRMALAAVSITSATSSPLPRIPGEQLAGFSVSFRGRRMCRRAYAGNARKRSQAAIWPPSPPVYHAAPTISRLRLAHAASSCYITAYSHYQPCHASILHHRRRRLRNHLLTLARYLFHKSCAALSPLAAATIHHHASSDTSRCWHERLGAAYIRRYHEHRGQ